MKVNETTKFKRQVCLPENFRENFRVKGIDRVKVIARVMVRRVSAECLQTTTERPPPCLPSPVHLSSAPRLWLPKSLAHVPPTLPSGTLRLLEAHPVRWPPKGGLRGLLHQHLVSSHPFVLPVGIFHAETFYCLFLPGRWAYPWHACLWGHREQVPRTATLLCCLKSFPPLFPNCIVSLPSSWSL